MNQNLSAFGLDLLGPLFLFCAKEIPYLKKYIPGSQTALVSCKNICVMYWLGSIKQCGRVCYDKILAGIDGYDFQIWKLITMSRVPADLLVQSAFRNAARRLALNT